MGRRVSAFITAKNHLINRINNSKQGERLPTINDMACSAQVSVVTMWKAVHFLESEGKLISKPKQGIQIVDSAVMHQKPTHSVTTNLRKYSTKWEAAAYRLKRMVISGTFASGSVLPPMKILCEELGICMHTLRKVLIHLEHSNCITRKKNHYYIKVYSPQPRRNKVVLITLRDTHSQTPAIITERTQKILETIYGECNRLHLFLEIVTCDKEGKTQHPEGGKSTILQKNYAAKNLLGFILLSTGINHPSGVDTIIKNITSVKKPVAIFDENYSNTAIKTISKKHRLFSISNDYHAGYQIGQHLVQRGVKSIGFISVVNQENWSLNRLQGLKAACAEMPEVTISIAANTTTWHTLFNSEQVPGEHISEKEFVDVLHKYQSEARDYLARSSARLAHAIEHHNRLITIEGSLFKLCEQLIKKSACTVWVAANDTMALFCKDFLAKNYPQRNIQIFGFDNHKDTRHSTISTYDFNANLCASNMIHFILNALSPLYRKSPEKIIRTEGELVLR